MSCAAVKQAGSTTSGYYTIDPDGAGIVSPFIVYCDLTASPVRTILHHDRETRQKVIYNSAYGSCSSISMPITYSHGVSYQQARAVVNQHSSCSYYYKHQCYETGLSCSTWIDYNNVGHNNWVTDGLCQSCK